MNDFPLQEELIDAVIGFANAKIDRPSQVTGFFGRTWNPTSIPQLSTCRKIQREVRGWLIDLNGMFIPALEGWGPAGWAPNSDRGIELKCMVFHSWELDGNKVDHTIKWEWSVAEASLRVICGLAVATLYQQDLHSRLGLCAREGCENIFIDYVSRGIPRKHCGTEECEMALNRARVKASRAAPRRKRNLKVRKK